MVDEKKIEANIFDRVQDLIDQVTDTSSLQLAISNCELKIQKLESVNQLKDKRADTDVKQLGLKVDNLDLKLDSCQDLISQLQADFGLNSTEDIDSQMNLLKVEL